MNKEQMTQEEADQISAYLIKLADRVRNGEFQDFEFKLNTPVENRNGPNEWPDCYHTGEETIKIYLHRDRKPTL